MCHPQDQSLDATRHCDSRHQSSDLFELIIPMCTVANVDAVQGILQRDPTGPQATPESDKSEPPRPYTLREHCEHLKLQREHTDVKSYWYCDWTSKFVSTNATLVKDIIKDYCQPFRTLAELQDHNVGISGLSPLTEDPLAVRTVSIRLRPDAQHYLILQAVHQAFTALHANEYYVVASTPQTFQAIGANGSVPYMISAFVSVHTKSLERRLWLRFYHVESVPVHLDDETSVRATDIRALLQRAKEETNKSKMAPLRNVLTPINTQLAEACVLVQFVLDGGLEPSFPCPAPTQGETTRFFQTTYRPSISALEESKNLPRHRNVERLFPSLSNEDYPILQESFSLMDRVWSELEMNKCTYNTLVEETSRFGMRPCQATLDKDFCHALSQISQQRMLLDLQQQIASAESILHDTLSQYHDFETLLIHVLRRKYNVPHAQEFASSLDLGQTPVKIPRRKLADFPWHDHVKHALGQVSKRIAQNCLVAFDPHQSIQMADDAVHHVFTAFGKRDDMDQQSFLKQRNRQAMIRVAQQQAVLKRLLETIILAPTHWPALPKLQTSVHTWYEISLQSTTSNTRRNPVPLLEFRTQLGQGCITAHQLILMSGLLSTSVHVYDWVDIDVQATPTHPLTKVAILSNGKRIGGFNPLDIQVDKLVQTIQILKQLQEA